MATDNDRDIADRLRFPDPYRNKNAVMRDAADFIEHQRDVIAGLRAELAWQRRRGARLRSPVAKIKG